MILSAEMLTTLTQDLKTKVFISSSRIWSRWWMLWNIWAFHCFSRRKKVGIETVWCVHLENQLWLKCEYAVTFPLEIYMSNMSESCFGSQSIFHFLTWMFYKSVLTFLSSVCLLVSMLDSLNCRDDNPWELSRESRYLGTMCAIQSNPCQIKFIQ